MSEGLEFDELPESGDKFNKILSAIKNLSEDLKKKRNPKAEIMPPTKEADIKKLCERIGKLEETLEGLQKKKEKYPYKYKYKDKENQTEENKVGISEVTADLAERVVALENPENTELKEELSAYTDFIKKFLKEHKGASIKDAANAWKKQKMEEEAPAEEAAEEAAPEAEPEAEAEEKAEEKAEEPAEEKKEAPEAEKKEEGAEDLTEKKIEELTKRLEQMEKIPDKKSVQGERQTENLSAKDANLLMIDRLVKQRGEKK